MDSERFDRLVQTFGRPRSRRSLTRLLGGMGLGGALSVWGTTETLAHRLNAGNPCTRGSHCKTGKCVGPRGQKVCSCSTRHRCADGARCIHGGCFRSESCAAECTLGTPCRDGCFCSETVSGVPVCYANEKFCTEGKACDANGDCPTGRACVNVSCVSCIPAVAAVCLFPCPVASMPRATADHAAPAAPAGR